ncbi:MAG TPA: glycosyltransferase [Candidatus Krumholzibacteria bacterium]|nr:glycosyltransferase [Candidatus Krumholzibacteria bacterium]
MSATPRPLRVLMVDSERTWRGGQGQVFLLMRGLAEAGQRVTLAAPAQGALFERSHTLDIERVPWRGTSSLSSILELRGIVARGRFDIVHSHASRAHGAVAVARIGVGGAPAHVVSRRVDFEVARGPWGRWKYHHGADAYIAISNGVRDVLVAGGVQPDAITVAPSGIDLEKFARVRDPGYLRDEFSLEPGVPVIVNVAALAPHKAQSVLLDALSRLRTGRRFRCFIVGEGGLRAQLEAQAGSLSLAGLTFTGFRNDALEFIRLADVFVMSSRLEGLGTSIMDAQALEAPVVATRTGGIPEIVEDGVTGLLAAPDDAVSLTAALERMLDDAALREHCRHNAKLQSAQYDYHRTVYKTLDVYRRLCHVEAPREGNPS